MEEFKNKVAVITGAASGIGRALAERFAREGMNVVLADVEAAALAQTEKEMRAAGATVLAVPTDVSRESDIESLAQKTNTTFGGVHLLCNNAGVSSARAVPMWDATCADWEWVMGVNLWGVIHGIRTFVPIMLEQSTPCHIVNTASIAGLITSGTGIYAVSKHAVVALSENLHFQLEQRKTQVKVSVLCPAWVNTRINDAERNRPTTMKDASEKVDPIIAAQQQAMRTLVQGGTSPDQIAEHVFQAVRDGRFYILPHPEMKRAVQKRVEIILRDGNPIGPRF